MFEIKRRNTFCWIIFPLCITSCFYSGIEKKYAIRSLRHYGSAWKSVAPSRICKDVIDFVANIFCQKSFNENCGSFSSIRTFLEHFHCISLIIQWVVVNNTDNLSMPNLKREKVSRTARVTHESCRIFVSGYGTHETDAKKCRCWIPSTG